MEPFKPPSNGASSKEALIALRKKQAAEAAANVSGTTDSTALARAKTYISPEKATDRLRIIFDNSGSMWGAKMKAAKDGVVEFLRNCSPSDTSVAIHLLNNESYYSWREDSLSHSLPATIKDNTLTADLILLASETMHESVNATGGTPLYETIELALGALPKATRLVAFSDGQPDHVRGKDRILENAKAAHIPIDTVYISGGYEDPSAIAELQTIAECTGGMFLNLAKGDIAKSLKYLSPGKRLMLADASFKSKVEKGEI